MLISECLLLPPKCLLAGIWFGQRRICLLLPSVTVSHFCFCLLIHRFFSNGGSLVAKMLSSKFACQIIVMVCIQSVPRTRLVRKEVRKDDDGGLKIGDSENPSNQFPQGYPWMPVSARFQRPGTSGAPQGRLCALNICSKTTGRYQPGRNACFWPMKRVCEPISRRVEGSRKNKTCYVLDQGNVRSRKNGGTKQMWHVD